MCSTRDATPVIVHCEQHLLNSGSQLMLDEYCCANGVYADVWKGSLDSVNVAVKMWRGASLSTSSRQLFVKRLAEELDKWKRIQHPNIVPFLGVMSAHGPLPALVLPFYGNGHVMQYLENNPSTDILHLLEGIASALNYMHSLTPPIVHGDIKGANILVNEDGHACLTDIGTSTIPYPPDWSVANREGARWMAPEVMDPGPDYEFDPDVYPVTLESDVYSFGMTALEMYSGRVPFAHRRFYGGVVFDVVRGLRPPRPACPNLEDDVWTLIQSCWNQDPKRRSSIDTVRSWLFLLSQMRKIRGSSTTRN
jgi:serine/threonine protein kinase